jgi:dTDP-4-amino-4,6-dideoxygalactose transaminase
MKSSNSKNRKFCGPPGIRVSKLIRFSADNAVQDYLNSASVFYTHKGRTAIRKACGLLGIESSDEILAPSYNCGSEIDPLLSSGAAIKLYRVKTNCQIDFDNLAKSITPKTKAIYVTHYFGFPQPIDDLKRISQETGLPLIEDCALSLFSKSGSVRLGTIGSMSIFSFPKSLPVPDGGALIVNDSKLKKDGWPLRKAELSEVSPSFLPIIKASVLRFISQANLYRHQYFFIGRGSNIFFQSAAVHEGMPEMPISYYYDEDVSNKGISAISNYLLKKFDVDSIIRKRRKNFLKLLAMLSGHNSFEILYSDLPIGVCPLSFPVIVKNRDELMIKLRELSIDAVAWWKGYHKGLKWDEFPEARFLKDNVLTLPVHQDLSDEDVDYIGKSFLRLVKDPAGRA